MNIDLHIERLILDGLQVEPRDQRTLRAAVEDELTRLLMNGGLRRELLSGGVLRAMSGREIHVPKQIGGMELGSQIAQAVHGGIGGDALGPRSESSANANAMSREFR